jgi:hypothetical protein
MSQANNEIIVDVVQRDGKYQLLESSSKGQITTPSKAPTTAAFEDVGMQVDQEVQYWGSHNTLPTDVRRKLMAVPLAMATIEKKVAMMYGEGIYYYKEDGTTKPKRAFIPEIEDFMRRCRINTEWYQAQCWDYCFLANTFSELVLSNDRKNIMELWHKPSEHTRLAPQNTSNNKVEWMKYSPLFANNAQPYKDKVATIPLFRWYEESEFFAWLRNLKFGWHTRKYSPGMTYYAVPPWVGLFKECGWLDISANVPRIVSAMQNNQIAIKYQIKIPISYFQNMYGDEWDSYDFKKREAAIRQKIQGLEDALQGSDNLYKTIAHTVGEDPITGRLLGDIQIIAIDDKVKVGTWIPDSNISDAQIVQAFGMHPSQMGLQPAGGKMGAGSGSDQRESFNTMIALNTIDQEIILEPLNFISRYNGWGVRFAVSHSTHTTSNLMESGIVPGAATIQPQ